MRYSGTALSLSRRLAQKKTTIEGLAPLLDVCRAASRLLVEKQPSGVELGSFAARLDTLTKRLESPLVFVATGTESVTAELGSAIESLDLPARLDAEPCQTQGNPELVVRIGGRDSSVHASRFLVGRDEGVEVPLKGMQHVSKRHLCFEPVGSGWTVTDVDSTNGTWLASPATALPIRLESSVASTITGPTRLWLGGEPGSVGTVELVVDLRLPVGSSAPDALVLCGPTPSMESLRTAERHPAMPILLCRNAALPAELSEGRLVGQWGDDIEAWLQQAAAVCVQTRHRQGVAELQNLLTDVVASVTAAIEGLARQADADRESIKASKSQGDKLKHLLDDAGKSMSEHHTRLRDAVRTKTDGQLNRRVASSLAARAASELAKYEPNLAMPCDLDLGVLRFQCIGQVTEKLNHVLQEMTEAWGTAIWASLAERRHAQVTRIREAIAAIPGAKPDWISSFEREREIGPKIIRRILMQPVVFSDTATLEHRNPLISILRSAQNSVMLLMMSMFMAARMGLLGRNEITLWLQRHDKIVLSLLVVLLVMAFISHFKGVAKAVRAAMQKDAEAILGYWISAIQEELETRLEHHAKEVKSVLDTKVSRAIDVANAQASDATSAAQTRISEAGSRIRQLEAYAEGLQVMVRTLPA